MQPTTLKYLLNTKSVDFLPYGIEIQTQSSWVVPDESHLSYTTLTRLVECCREYHWRTDIIPYLGSTSVDSICKSVNAEFLKPVPVSSIIKIGYSVKQVRTKGYELLFKICIGNQINIHAIFQIVLVFYDTKTTKTIAIPDAAKNKLIELWQEAMAP